MTTFIITAIILWVLFAIFKSLAKKFGGFNVFGFTTICLAFILVAVSEDEVAVVSEDEVAVSNVEEKVLQHCHNTLQTGKTFCSYAFRDNNYRIWKRRAELKAKDEAARKQKKVRERRKVKRENPDDICDPRINWIGACRIACGDSVICAAETGDIEGSPCYCMRKRN